MLAVFSNKVVSIAVHGFGAVTEHLCIPEIIQETLDAFPAMVALVVCSITTLVLSITEQTCPPGGTRAVHSALVGLLVDVQWNSIPEGVVREVRLSKNTSRGTLAVQSTRRVLSLC
mmetsp:Transcript_18763/g.43582  ORF Transcript_18763/g.43582 Transcript_18763/m.43582 type:complete len:116 (-) Transcript_18763:83-430(-)